MATRSLASAASLRFGSLHSPHKSRPPAADRPPPLARWLGTRSARSLTGEPCTLPADEALPLGSDRLDARARHCGARSALDVVDLSWRPAAFAPALSGAVCDRR